MTQDTLKDVTGCLRTILESVVMEMWKCVWMFEDVLRIPLMGYFSMSEVVLMHSDISYIYRCI